MSEPIRSLEAELSALLASWPGVGSPPRAQADWYERQAALLERVAAESDGAAAGDAAEVARVARNRAARLRGSRS